MTTAFASEHDVSPNAVRGPSPPTRFLLRQLGPHPLAWVSLFALACSSPPVVVAAPPPVTYSPVTSGVAAGDVTPQSTVIWARTNRYAVMHTALVGGGHEVRAQAWVSEAHDYAAAIPVKGLEPDTEYSYSVWFSSDERPDHPPPGFAESGKFRTAPEPRATRAVTFGFSGDLGGINVCRDRARGYPVFRTIDGRALDFFIGLGDMIYADHECKPIGLFGNEQVPAAVGASTTLRDYWAHWKYNRDDAGLRRLLAETGYYAVWDDHEVVNDFGPDSAFRTDPPYVLGASLLPLGRQALFDENPIERFSSSPDRLYRSFRWGRHVELVILDTRSYRDSNRLADTDERPKTMLGPDQRRWFEDVVTHSDATWKVVVSSVPISVPTGGGGSAGHDGWANFDLDVGFERELASIWRAFRDAGTKNVVFVTTDVHFATGFTYHPFPESPDFTIHELTGGPLSAKFLPNRDVDPSFNPERLYFFGPEATPNTFEDAMGFMNWVHIAIDEAGKFSYSVRNALGREVASGVLPTRR